MAVKSFLRSSGIAAIAAGLALSALSTTALAEPNGNRGPWGGRAESSSAQSRSGGDNRGDGNQGRNRGGEGRGSENRGGWSQRTQPAPAQQAQPAPQRRGWIDGQRVQNSAPQTSGQAERSWSRGRQATVPVPAARATSPDRPDRGTQSRYQGDRNRTYADRDRNSSYRNGNRGPRSADGYRDRDRNHQRDTFREGNGHYSRYNGNRNNQWRDDNRSAYRGNYRHWNNDWRRDNRYDWHSYRNYNRNVYRVGRYYSPYRYWSYRPLSIGFSLNSLFYSSNYWINDPWQYRLPPAYGPYRWVRYYNDALLVNIYDGQVVDVIRNFFW